MNNQTNQQALARLEAFLSKNPKHSIDIYDSSDESNIFRNKLTHKAMLEEGVGSMYELLKKIKKEQKIKGQFLMAFQPLRKNGSSSVRIKKPVILLLVEKPLDAKKGDSKADTVVDESYAPMTTGHHAFQGGAQFTMPSGLAGFTMLTGLGSPSDVIPLKIQAQRYQEVKDKYDDLKSDYRDLKDENKKLQGQLNDKKVELATIERKHEIELEAKDRQSKAGDSFLELIQSIAPALTGIANGKIKAQQQSASGLGYDLSEVSENKQAIIQTVLYPKFTEEHAFVIQNVMVGIVNEKWSKRFTHDLVKLIEKHKIDIDHDSRD